MRIEVDGTEHTVDFYHYPKEAPTRTVCCIDKEWGLGGIDWGLGQSRCGKLDTFKKSTGRKIALTRALIKYPRDFRRKFWESYLQQARV